MTEMLKVRYLFKVTMCIFLTWRDKVTSLQTL